MWRKRGLGWHLDFWPEGLQGQSTCDLRWSGLARKVSHVPVTPPSEGLESGVWEGGLQFPNLLSDPRTASRTPFVPLGAVILLSKRFLEPLFTARLEKQSLRPLLPEFPPLPISGLHEMRMSTRVWARTPTHTQMCMRAHTHTRPECGDFPVLSYGRQRCMSPSCPRGASSSMAASRWCRGHVSRGGRTSAVEVPFRDMEHIFFDRLPLPSGHDLGQGASPLGLPFLQ